MTADNRLFQIYKEHPLQYAAIVARLAARGKNTTELTELDLAIDDVGELTDQNHIGGLPFVRALAQHAQVSAATRVIDLGSGLGGPARVLASDYGCAVLGIDISPHRHHMAERLTRLVKLSHLVRFQCADILTIPVPQQTTEVLWAQNSLLHVSDLTALFSRWMPALTEDGRFALEDVYLARDGKTIHNGTALAELSDAWLTRLVPLKQWTNALSAAGFSLSVQVDLSEKLVPWFDRLLASADSNTAPREVLGWQRARYLSMAGIIGYFRLVGTKNR